MNWSFSSVTSSIAASVGIRGAWSLRTGAPQGTARAAGTLGGAASGTAAGEVQVPRTDGGPSPPDHQPPRQCWEVHQRAAQARLGLGDRLQCLWFGGAGIGLVSGNETIIGLQDLLCGLL
jgi:hypothetical protein